MYDIFKAHCRIVLKLSETTGPYHVDHFSDPPLLGLEWNYYHQCLPIDLNPNIHPKGLPHPTLNFLHFCYNVILLIKNKTNPYQNMIHNQSHYMDILFPPHQAKNPNYYHQVYLVISQ